MDFNLGEEHRLLREQVRRFAVNELAPQAPRLDETGEYPRETVSKLAEQGMLGVLVPEEYGGAEMDFTSLTILVEEVSRACASHGVILAVHNSLVTYPLLLYGTEEQKKKYLPQLCSGKRIGAFALTEPDAGSDAAGIKTTATKDGDHWVLNGSKIFITNGEAAGLFLVTAKTDPSKGHSGITAFLVERETPGFEIGRHENLMGMRGTGNVPLSFQDARVPAENVLGQVNQGFPLIMSLLDSSRIDIAAQALGIAQASLDAAVAYAKQRVQFGKPIWRHEMVQDMLARMAVQVDAARLLVYRASWLKDSGAERCTKEASMAKLFASEAAVEVSRLAVQILGGYGYSRDYPVERYYREAKVTEIYEGTSQIQKIVIARQLTR